MAGKIHSSSAIIHSRCIFLAGPTAVGKSALALGLAEKIGGEIISVDSMQVYRGLDIGTAKPSAEEQRRAQHHLIDICELAENFDAAKFVQLAEKAAAEIQLRGNVPIFCGGTGLYFKGLLEGLGEAPPADPQLRSQLETLPLKTLLDELRNRDPVAYERIDRQNPRRVVRAVEVIRLTGKPFSAQQSAWANQDTSRTAHYFYCLTRPSPELHARINARVDEMFHRGLVAETEAALKRGLTDNKTAMQAIGYRQVVEYLQGLRTLAETVDLIKIRTRQFAKRQLTWFRRHGNCRWIDCSAVDANALIGQLTAEVKII